MMAPLFEAIIRQDLKGSQESSDDLVHSSRLARAQFVHNFELHSKLAFIPSSTPVLSGTSCC